MTNQKRGLLITFEGIDGCGKSTLSKMLVQWLKAQNYSVLHTFEPGGSELGKRLRQLLLQDDFTASGETLGDKAELLMFAADRAQHVLNVIAPAIESGTFVVCDRYIDSTFAYQGGGRKINLKFLAALNDFAVGDMVPDLTFYLRVPMQLALKRRGRQTDRMEREDLKFHEDVAAAYEKLANQYPKRIHAIDGAGNPEEVFILIQPIMEQYLAQYNL